MACTTARCGCGWPRRRSTARPTRCCWAGWPTNWAAPGRAITLLRGDNSRRKLLQVDLPEAVVAARLAKVVMVVVVVVTGPGAG